MRKKVQNSVFDCWAKSPRLSTQGGVRWMSTWTKIWCKTSTLVHSTGGVGQNWVFCLYTPGWTTNNLIFIPKLWKSEVMLIYVVFIDTLSLFYSPFLSSESEICWVDDTKLELSWCRWNFLAWCLVIFLSAINPITNSSKTIVTIRTFAALSMGKITKSSLKSRNPCIGNWSKTVSSQKPANSGTFSVRLPK